MHTSAKFKGRAALHFIPNLQSPRGSCWRACDERSISRKISNAAAKTSHTTNQPSSAALACDQGHTSAHTASHVAQVNWRPDEDVGNNDQGRPRVLLRLRMTGKVLGELAQGRRAWSASMRNVIKSEC